jgi:Icc-related predicted phosphoesterase
MGIRVVDQTQKGTVMDVKFISDIHLEFDVPMDPGKGDVLILAGDILCARHLAGEDPMLSPYGSQYLEFLEKCSKGYNRVFMVMGNHEHYGYNIDKSYETISQHLPENIRLLEDECEIIDDWMFIGSTMWTDCNKQDPITLMHLNDGMNDFRTVRKGDGSAKFLSIDSYVIHRSSRAYFDKMISEAGERGLKVFAITHHAPHETSVDDIYKSEQIMNGGFRSDLSDIMLDRPQLRYWVHGHMHNKSDYMIGDCRVMANPRGYPRSKNGKYFENEGFDPKWKIKLT